MIIPAQLRKHICIESPRCDDRKLRAFLRKHFGDNDIHQLLSERRWATYDMGNYIFFKNEADVIWFRLKWQ